MADEVVFEILKGIQRAISVLDQKVTRQHAVLTQDIRMIRAAIHDMGETRVTEGEIVALHEDVNRVQQRVDDLVTRVEMLESQHD